ncbi:MAG: hypothetical protein OK454_00180 [Thaumarchaeota archaeon]|nr:hypothetical protein [Nitrososphaerota archaeon]
MRGGVPRYSFHCVAPEVQGPGSTDDLYEALLFTCDYYGSHFDIWDNVMQEYVPTPCCPEEEAEIRQYVRERYWPRRKKAVMWVIRKLRPR